MTLEAEIAELRSEVAALRADLRRNETKRPAVARAAHNQEDAAYILGVDRKILTRLIAEGHIYAAPYPGMRYPRIPQWSIDAFLSTPNAPLEVAS